MIILLHTSKTMRAPVPPHAPTAPALYPQAAELATYIAGLSPRQLEQVMHISSSLAEKTAALFDAWPKGEPSLAIDSFVGDIYSGLRPDLLTAGERRYAQAHLRILSGLYGILRPFDGIRPYRLEMGYRVPETRFADLYDFWGEKIAAQLPATGSIVNLAAAEYSRTVLPFVASDRVISPRFLTRDPDSGELAFVVVHAKIARGAFARWLIATRIQDVTAMTAFAEIGYRYDAALSTPQEPTFVCEEFQGKGLSMRLLDQ